MVVRIVRKFADSLNGIKYPCAVCGVSAVVFTPPDPQGRRMWCGEHFDKIGLDTIPPRHTPSKK